jgi:hypothetical protein
MKEIMLECHDANGKFIFSERLCMDELPRMGESITVSNKGNFVIWSINYYASLDYDLKIHAYKIKASRNEE